MTDNTKAHGLNRAEGVKPSPKGTGIYPGQVPSGIDGSAERAQSTPAPSGGPQYQHVEKPVRGRGITVSTRVDVVPCERPAAGGFTPKRANWRNRGAGF
jgi:hypothetical protein